MFQLLLALLSHGTKKNINMLRVFFILGSHRDNKGAAQSWKQKVRGATWKKAQSEHCLHKLSERGLFWQ